MRKNNTKFRIAGRRVLAALFVCVMTLSLLTVSAAAAFPKPVDNIADQAGQLSESTIRQIKKTNETLEEQTDCAIAVCTVLTTGDTPIGDYAKELFLDWKLGEGVLILIAAEDTNYYLLQSSGVDKVLSNEVLTEIRDEYLEENFAAGNVDRGVLQCVTKIAQNLIKIKADDAAAETADNAEQPAEKKNSVGSFIVGFFKAILYIVLILAVLFIAFFILAMFNDDAAALLQKYVFQRGNQQKMPEQYYDERLYGDGQRPRNAQNRGQNPNQRRPQNGQYPGYRTQNPYAGQRVNNGQLQSRQNPNGYLQQPRNGYAQQQVPQQYAQQQYAQQAQYAQQTQQVPMNRTPQQRQGNPYYAQQTARTRAPQNGYNPNTGYSQNYAPQAQQAPSYADSNETRAYTIPGRGQNR